ncbi:MAG: DUF6538 domain-containing protein [Bradyrhizobium sp.]|jgi:hypothetical protein
MSLATNVVRRPGSAMYYARVKIPLELRKFYPIKGKATHRDQLWKSLGTRDPKEARDLALPVLAELRRQFAEMAARREATEADLQAAVWDRYQEGLAGC